MSLTGPAAARLFDEHVDAVHAYVARRVGAELAPEVVADVFTEALRTHDRFVEHDLAPRGGERGWLFAVATALLRRHAAAEHDRLVDWERVAAAATATPTTADPLLGAGDSPTADRAPAVMRGVAALDPADRDLLLLTTWERCTIPVAAEAARVAPGAAKARLNEIRDELRRGAADADGGRRRAVNPIQVVEAVRPAHLSMPDGPRRHLRERLFELATAARPDVGRVGEFGVAGATVPTVDVGRRSILLRLGALVLLGLVGVGGLALASNRGGSSDDTDGATGTAVDDGESATGSVAPGTETGDLLIEPTVAPPTITIPPLPDPTLAPTTTVPPVAGTEETPLLLPPERSRLESLVVTRAALGGSSLLLRAPDQSTLALREVDGVAPTTAPPSTDPESGETVPTTAPRDVGTLSVGLAGEPGRYDVTVPCGALALSDGPDRLPFRPAVQQLLESVTLDAGAVRLTPPPDWVVLDQSSSVDSFQFGVPVEVGGRRVVVTLTQYPGAGIALPGFGGAQYSPTTFFGQQAWISRQADDPARYEVVGRLGTTAFSVATSDLALAELEGVLGSFSAGDVDEWVERFGALPTRPDPDIRRCTEQPEFVLP